uniref:E4 protein n=1 Tax=Human papillomavirus TaxID=10566 RepID=H2BQ91_9PAPI|nr:E4 protein [Human papillomavirus]
MACITLRLVVTKFTLHYLIQMIKGLEAPETGVCILKIKLLSPLLALQIPTLLTPGRTPPPPFPVPPKTPYPPRKAQEESKGRRSVLAPRKHLHFDEDEEKENQPPKDEQPPQQKEEEEEEEEEELNELLRLLRQWGRDIDQFQHRICRDLQDFRRRLGIPQ